MRLNFSSLLSCLFSNGSLIHGKKVPAPQDPWTAISEKEIEVLKFSYRFFILGLCSLRFANQVEAIASKQNSGMGGLCPILTLDSGSIQRHGHP
jgi:hypothetical protein